MIDLGRLAASSITHALAFEGQWHAIEFQPELEVPQRFVIGVAISQRDKLIAYRIAEEAPKLRCFYGQRFGKDVWQWLRTQLATELKTAANIKFSKFSSSSPQIYFSRGHYTSGSSPDAAMARAFQRIVTVIKGDVKPRSIGVAQVELREMMARFLKLKMSTHYEAISLGAHGMQIKDGDEVHTFDINYDNAAIASSVVSASYASLETAKLNVMTAASDLYRFAKIKNRDQMGLAVLLPSPDLFSRETVATWNTWWANESYKFKQSSSMMIAESTNQEQLAEYVLDWYQDPE